MNKQKLLRIQKSKYILCPKCGSNAISCLNSWVNRKIKQVYCECNSCEVTFETPEPYLNKIVPKEEIFSRIMILDWDKKTRFINPNQELEIKLLSNQVNRGE